MSKLITKYLFMCPLRRAIIDRQRVHISKITMIKCLNYIVLNIDQNIP